MSSTLTVTGLLSVAFDGSIAVPSCAAVLVSGEPESAESWESALVESSVR